MKAYHSPNRSPQVKNVAAAECRGEGNIFSPQIIDSFYGSVILSSPSRMESERIKMKMFAGIFVLCVIACYVAVLVFSSSNVWVSIFVAAFVLAAFITALVKQAIKIEDVEKSGNPAELRQSAIGRITGTAFDRLML